MDVGAVKAPTIRRSHTMQTITTIGLDIAKSVFQVHGVDAQRQCRPTPSIEAPVPAGLLPEAAAVPDWHRSLCLVASLVTRAPSARSHGSADAAGLCEALRQAAEERCYRCGSNLRGGHPSEHAVRRDQDARAAKLPDASPHPSFTDPPADLGDQCD